MGLDMYLSATKWGHGYEHGSEQEKEQFATIINALGANFYDKDSPTYTIQINVGYWRKANAIHGWFVDNVQDGEDNCRRYDVSREQLAELQKACIEVLADNTKARELLPPSEGFFFGGYELDEYYYDELRRTVILIGDVLKKVPEDWFLQYQSSW